MLMRNFQLPEAAFTYQRPGTCPRARHCRRQMGSTAGKDCTEGTAPSRGWAPLLRAPFFSLRAAHKTQLNASRNA